MSVGSFSARRLGRGRRKLVKRRRKLTQLGDGKRHRLRLRAKRFRHALEWSLPLQIEAPALAREQIKQAKAIQDALGQLNDSHAHQTQARTLKLGPLPAMVRLGRWKPQTRRLKTARRAFSKLSRLH